MPATGKSTGKAHRSGLSSWAVLFCYLDVSEESRQTVCAAHRLRVSAGQAAAQRPARLLQGQLIADHKTGAPRGLMRLARAKNAACVWKH